MKGSFDLKAASDDVFHLILDFSESNTIFRLWLSGDKEIQSRLESARKVSLIFRFGTRSPLNLLQRFSNIDNFTIGYDAHLWHCKFPPTALPETLKTITKLSVRSQSFSRQLDVDLASTFPCLVEFSYDLLTSDDISAKKWILPQTLRYIEFMHPLTDYLRIETGDGNLPENLPSMNVSSCEWFSKLPSGVRTIRTNVLLSFSQCASGALGVKWPQSLTTFDVEHVQLPPEYLNALEEACERNELFPTLDASPTLQDQPCAQDATSSSTSTSVDIDTVRITSYMNLPHSLERFKARLPKFPPVASLPQSLKSLQLKCVDPGNWNLNHLMEQYLTARPTLRKIEIAARIEDELQRGCFSSIDFLMSLSTLQSASSSSSSRFNGTPTSHIGNRGENDKTLKNKAEVEGIGRNLTSDFNHFTQLEAVRLAIGSNAIKLGDVHRIIASPAIGAHLRSLTLCFCAGWQSVSKIDFSPLPSLRTLIISSQGASTRIKLPKMTFPTSLESIWVKGWSVANFHSSTVLPPNLLSYSAHQYSIPSSAGLRYFPSSLTELRLTEPFQAAENFNPRFLPPQLRRLSVHFRESPDARAVLYWWNLLPETLPLESLAILAPNDRKIVLRPELTVNPPILPFIHPTLKELSICVMQIDEALARHIVENLTSKISRLYLISTARTVQLPENYLNMLPDTLREVQTSILTKQDVYERLQPNFDWPNFDADKLGFHTF